MRLPWKKQPEFYEPERRPKQKETLRQTADKLIQRRMKKDPDGYGLKTAERLTGVEKEQPVSLKAQLNELRELKETLQDLGLTSDGGGKSLMQTLIENLPAIVQALPQVAAQMQRQQQSVQPVEQYVPPAPQPKQLVKPDPAGVSLGDLIPLLDEEPEQALAELKVNHPEWVTLLATNSYEKLVEMVTPFTANPQFGQQITELLVEKAEWLKKLVELAHKMT